MHKNYFISDPHFGHHNILKFLDNNGKLTREFKSIEEHDNEIIKNINAVVRPCDKLFILGDVAMNRKCISTLDRIITKKKILIRDCNSFRGLNNNFIRIAVKKHKENLKLIKALEAI